jgi:predicted transglutaminase-like cysteine proteinase
MAVPPDLWGWTPVECPPDPRWLAVKDARLVITPAMPTTAAEIDLWAQRNVAYQAEAIDEWSHPQETLDRSCGDCEDIALLKRAILIEQGVPEERIFFLLLHDLIVGQDHAALIVDDDGWKFLDSRLALKMTLPIEDVPDFTPLFAMQGGGCWLFGRRL